MRRPGAPLERFVRRPRRGFTVVELLVAGVILVTILGLGSAFLARQAQLQRLVQARSQVQDTARVVLQIVTQDLSLAGATHYIFPDGRVTFPESNACASSTGASSRPGCFSVDADGSPYLIAVRYVSSQFPEADACREVRYRVTDEVLERADVPCGRSTDVGDGDFAELAAPTVAFGIEIVCSDAAVVTGGFATEADACASTAYPRTAVVAFEGASTIRAAGGPVTFAQNLEVLMPNLKVLAEFD